MKLISGDTPAARNGQRRAVITLTVFGLGAAMFGLAFEMAVERDLEVWRFIVVACAAVWSIGGFFAGAALADWLFFRRHPQPTWPFEDERPHK